MGEFQDAIEEIMGKKWVRFGTVIAALVVIYLISSLVFGMWPFSIARNVANADSVISNYQWYYDQYNQIQAQLANYNSMPDDAAEKNGLRMVLNNMIGEYNSRSKQITRNLWKAADLPYQIEMVGGSK